MVAEARIPRVWGGQITQEGEEVEEEGVEPASRAAECLETGDRLLWNHEECGLRLAEGSGHSRCGGRTDYARRWNQALVLQCSLVALRDSPTKNQKEEERKALPGHPGRREASLTRLCPSVSAGKTTGEKENARLPRPMRQTEGHVLRQLEELDRGPPYR